MQFEKIFRMVKVPSSLPENNDKLLDVYIAKTITNSQQKMCLTAISHKGCLLRSACSLQLVSVKAVHLFQTALLQMCLFSFPRLTKRPMLLWTTNMSLCQHLRCLQHCFPLLSLFRVYSASSDCYTVQHNPGFTLLCFSSHCVR